LRSIYAYNPLSSNIGISLIRVANFLLIESSSGIPDVIGSQVRTEHSIRYRVWGASESISFSSPPQLLHTNCGEDLKRSARERNEEYALRRKGVQQHAYGKQSLLIGRVSARRRNGRLLYLSVLAATPCGLPMRRRKHRSHDIIVRTLTQSRTSLVTRKRGKIGPEDAREGQDGTTSPD
jgi:hypothetical protein